MNGNAKISVFKVNSSHIFSRFRQMLHNVNAFHFEVKFADKRVQWLDVYDWSQISWVFRNQKQLRDKLALSKVSFHNCSFRQQFVNLCCY